MTTLRRGLDLAFCLLCLVVLVVAGVPEPRLHELE